MVAEARERPVTGWGLRQGVVRPGNTDSVRVESLSHGEDGPEVAGPITSNVEAG